jgi:hypothetical protein
MKIVRVFASHDLLFDAIIDEEGYTVSFDATSYIGKKMNIILKSGVCAGVAEGLISAKNYVKSEALNSCLIELRKLVKIFPVFDKGDEVWRLAVITRKNGWEVFGPSFSTKEEIDELTR